MLDQNTDRMWYVIGALVVGAGIILLANKTMPEIFASVADTFKEKTDEVTEITDAIGVRTTHITKDFEVVGETVYQTDPVPDKPADIEYVSTIVAGSETIVLDNPLRSVNDVQDKLFLDGDGFWVVERNIGVVELNGSSDVRIRKDIRLGENHTAFEIPNALVNGLPMNESKIRSNRFDVAPFINNNVTNAENTEYIRNSHAQYPNHVIIGIANERLTGVTNEGIQQWLGANPITVMYIQKPTMERLPATTQEQLNALMK